MSSKDEWYRSSDWSPAAQETFERKIAHVRTPYNRAQYVKLKALSLLKTGSPTKREAAIDLLTRVVRDHGADPKHMVRLMVVDSHELLGRAYEADGQLVKAEEQYRQAIEACTIQPRTPMDSELQLAELIVRTHQRENFDEARQLISLDPVFPEQRFRYLTAEARMAALEGDERKAAICASAALGILRQQMPLIPRIPGFGLAEPEEKTRSELERLASLLGPASEEDLELLPAWLHRAVTEAAQCAKS